MLPIKISALSLKQTRTDLAPGTYGAMNELYVSVALMEDGWAVYRALSPHAPVDLIATKGPRLIRVEVRSSTWSESGKLQFGRNDETGTQTHYAAVTRDEIVFIPPLDETCCLSSK